MKKKLLLLLIPIKLILIITISNYIYKILSDEDSFYSERGINNSCQKTTNLTDKKLCSKNKFKKFLIYYIDSVPYDLFMFKNKNISKNSEHFKIKHYGIFDSGPAFSSFVTGKVANKYEGLISGIDNLFTQFKIGGYKLKGYGYSYPIEEMLGKDSFDEYKNIENGLTEALCDDFVKIRDIGIKDFDYIKQSLIFSKEDYEFKFSKFYDFFTNKLKTKKNKIFECLKKKIQEEDFSYFIYNVYTDTIGHQYSRQSEIYIKKIAGLKANIDIIIEFYKKYEKENIFMVLSDHGIVSSLWESEINNHGVPQNGNESFFYAYSTKLNQKKTLKKDSIDSFKFPSYLTQLISDINIPMNAKGKFKPLFNNFESRFTAYRTKELQINSFFQSFDQNFIEFIDIKINNNYFLKLSAFYNKKKFNSKKEVKKLLDQYENYINYLIQKLNYIKKINTNKNELKNYFIFFCISLLFIFKNIYQLFYYIKNTDEVTGFFSLFSLIFLPLIFIFFSKIIEILFIPYFLAINGIYSLFLVHKNSDKIYQIKISAILLSSLLIVIYNKIVSYDYFYFFYYQNEFLQILLIITMILVHIYLLKFSLEINQKDFFNKNLKILYIILYIILDIIIIIYEIILIKNFDYHQTTFMMYLSRFFYIIIVFLLLLSLNFNKNYKLFFFIILFKANFWLGINYSRIIFYIILLPCLLYYYKTHINLIKNFKKDKKYNYLFDIILLTLFSGFLFKANQGHLDTNISVRVGNRNWAKSLEIIPSFTGVIFSIYKFLPFIIIYFYMFILYKNDNFKSKGLDLISDFFDSKILKVSEIWFGFSTLIYLITITDPINQRASFMMYSANIIFIISAYIITFIDYLMNFMEKKHSFMLVNNKITTEIQIKI